MLHSHVVIPSVKEGRLQLELLSLLLVWELSAPSYTGCLFISEGHERYNGLENRHL